MENEQSYVSITTAARIFLDSIQQCIQQPVNLGPREIMLLQDQLGRFSIWASETGVFAPRRASLDHRLRYVPEIQRLVRGLLETLDDHLHHYLTQQNEERDLSAIAKDLTLLHRLSNTIRRASRESQNLRAAEHFRIEDEEGVDVGAAWRDTFAAEVIRRKWPACDDWLRERLASAMLLRRKRVLYRRFRHDKARMDQSVPGRDAEDQGQKPEADHEHVKKRETTSARSASGSRATTSATTLNPEQFRKASAPSVLGTTRTTRMNTQEESLYPPAPKGEIIKRLETLEKERSTSIEDSGQHSSGQDAELSRREKIIADRHAILRNSEVVCPYCCCTLSGADVMDDRKWRNHLKHDLDAYVCLFEECATETILYSHSEEWLNHLREHKVRWRCTAKAHGILIFEDQADYLDHIRNKHKGSESQLRHLTERGSQPSGPLFVICPLCNAEAAKLNIPVEDHIASHLRYLALQSLPFVEYNAQASGEDGSLPSSDGERGSRSTLDDDFDGDLSFDLADELHNPFDSHQDEVPSFAADSRPKRDVPLFAELQKLFETMEKNQLSASKNSLIESKAEQVGIDRTIDASNDPAQSYPSSPPASLDMTSSDSAKGELIASLEKLIMEERAGRPGREETASRLLRATAKENTTSETGKSSAAGLLEAARKEASDSPDRKRSTVEFRDAVGRRLSFPFDACRTWEGMESLIRQSFSYMEGLESHVAAGHYDLVGPNGDIILPQIWESSIQPGWVITMHMWPLSGRPVTPSSPGEPSVPPANAAVSAEPTGSETAVPRKSQPKAHNPGAFAMWMMGDNRLSNQALEKEEE
ncbi:uncharacterized protein BO72DRAFT_529568 [Aspergillus fijiensis CBS 313.89]|uniref:Ubiquitin-like domain-containing protein n=1 Tax=Aspergillus fijiensis CBS 313.89 TaxID=1448319 RepID=A0A8G1RMN5_9EURO|nr:uncharacterized protein BO72DRAFT_529568 [Aspergillus fijiensis CBS 313.89]RAK75252.1 hypothetical protein BO72DRAFT_529568 [Aspergillus fijiensis CBS 313.89]